MRAPKETQKTFALHWGSGIIAEEAQIATEHHRPTIQLLEFTDGPAKGGVEIRFCFYDHRGRFQRAPLILDEGDVAALGRALAKTPRLKRLVARLAGK